MPLKLEIDRAFGIDFRHRALRLVGVLASLSHSGSVGDRFDCSLSAKSTVTLEQKSFYGSAHGLNLTFRYDIECTHVSELLGTRLGLLASICQSTTRNQVMTRL